MEQLFSLEYMVSILLSGISLGGQLALIAIGYTMVYGILRLINFAHGDVFMVAGLLGDLCFRRAADLRGNSCCHHPDGGAGLFH